MSLDWIISKMDEYKNELIREVCRQTKNANVLTFECHQSCSRAKKKSHHVQKNGKWWTFLPTGLWKELLYIILARFQNENPSKVFEHQECRNSKKSWLYIFMGFQLPSRFVHLKLIFYRATLQCWCFTVFVSLMFNSIIFCHL